MTQIDWSGLNGPKLTRRTLMKLIGVTSAVGLLAACGGDDDSTDESEPTNTTEAAPAAGTTPAGTDATEPAETDGTEPAEEASPTDGAAATSPGGQQTEGTQGGTLRFGFWLQQIQDLDPAQVAIGVVAGELVGNLFSSLVQFDEALSVGPDLAESWEISDDGTEYTFHLREGLTFHNGDTLTAEDLVYTAERTVDPELASAHANKLLNVTSTEAVDELTFKLTLSEPNGPFLATTCSRGPGRALTPVPRRAVEELGNEQFNLTPVGCGPFMMDPESMDPTVGFDMLAFEGWYAGRPLLDKIEVRLIPEPSSIVSALEAGDIDMADRVPPQGFEQLESNDDIELVRAPGTNWIGLQLNLSTPPFDQLDARLAIAKAIDKQQLVDTALFGLAIPSIGALAPAFQWAYLPPEEWGENPQAFDLDGAKALAETIDWGDQEFVFLAGSANTRPEEVVRNMLSEIGVQVRIDPVQNVVETERWQAGDYDMTIQGSVVDADPDDNAYNFFVTDGPWNTNGWTNAECDEYLAAERATNDQDERRQIFQDLQRLLQAEAPMPFLYHTDDIVGFHSYVMGYKPIPEMRYLETVWLDQ